MGTDNGSFAPKARLRVELLAALGRPRVLEGFTGEGRLYRACWSGCAGATIDKDEGKARDAARERPTWAVYQGDTRNALRAGWMAHVPFEVVDLDAYGSPWGFVQAWFASSRARAPLTHILLTDGYMVNACTAMPCRVLFPGFGAGDTEIRDRAHRLTKEACAAGTIDNREGCEACGVAQATIERGDLLVLRHHFDYEKPVDTIPLCRRCHRLVHAGKLPEPRTGRVYTEGRATLDCPPELYLETARRRLEDWARDAPTPLAVEHFETIAHRRMRLHTVRVRLVA